MSLRARLALALGLVALLPLGVAVATSMLRAERRAREEAEGKLRDAVRRAEIVVERHRRETDTGLIRAAQDLAEDRRSLDALRGTGLAAAREIARSLAERNGLDGLEVLATDGTVLSGTGFGDAVGARSAMADLGPGMEARTLGPPGHRDPAVGFVARRAIAGDDPPLALAGGRVVGRDLVEAIAEITGSPALLVEPSGGIAVDSAAGGAGRDSRAAEVPLGDGWRLRVTSAEADVRKARADLARVFAGVAPVAILSAVVAAILLAEAISRPMRALAARAEEIASERAGPSILAPERDEVRQLTLAFDRMLDALSSSETQRLAAERVAAWQDVARRIAHEVKNPLSPIRLAVENLRRTRERAPQDLERALETETAVILEEVESLRRLVDEFSEFARMPRPRPIPCSPRAVLSQALGLLDARIRAQGVEVEVTDGAAPESMVADPDQVGRVLKNVLANALDAMETVPRRRLEVAARAAAGPAGPAVEFVVRDTGVGLDPESLRRVFEPYFSTRAERGGTGLGMAIAHRIVSEHGGSIRVEGAPGLGATVSILLPVDGPPARA